MSIHQVEKSISNVIPAQGVSKNALFPLNQSIESDVEFKSGYTPDILKLLKATQSLVNELRESGDDKKVSFSSDLKIFLFQYVAAQTNISNTTISIESIANDWHHLTLAFSDIKDKNPEINNEWIKISSIMSNHLLTKKMINADRLAFKSV